MNNEKKLFWVKMLHTAIWAVYVFIIFYIVWAGITGKINVWTWAAIGSVVLEGVILLAFKWRCPLTVVAYKYTEEREDGFDIFIPKWLAKHNKLIFTIIFGVGVVLVMWRGILKQ